MNGKHDSWKYRRKNRSLCACRHLCCVLPTLCLRSTPPIPPGHGRELGGRDGELPDRLLRRCIALGEKQRGAKSRLFRFILQSTPIHKHSPLSPNEDEFPSFLRRKFDSLCPPFEMHCEVKKKRYKNSRTGPATESGIRRPSRPLTSRVGLTTKPRHIPNRSPSAGDHGEKRDPKSTPSSYKNPPILIPIPTLSLSLTLRCRIAAVAGS